LKETGLYTLKIIRLDPRMLHYMRGISDGRPAMQEQDRCLAERDWLSRQAQRKSIGLRIKSSPGPISERNLAKNLKVKIKTTRLAKLITLSCIFLSDIEYQA
jgi:hypothetical protein